MSKLGQLLVARGWITVQQLTRALQTQNTVGGRLGTCLLEMDVLSEELLVRSLSEQLGVPAAGIEDLRAIPDEVLQLIPERLARRCRAIPFQVLGGRLDVAMQDPRNLVCQDELAFACGRRVKVHVLHELRIYEALQRHYREECPARYALLLDRLNRARYLWTAKEGAQPPPPGTVPASLQGMAGRRPAGAAGERPEVLSALTPEGLLSGAPRMEPPPLPEPGLPPEARRRSLFRSRAGGAAPAPGGGGAERELPPLEELDLRPPPPTRRRPDEAATGAKGAASPPDLETTLTLGPPALARPPALAQPPAAPGDNPQEAAWRRPPAPSQPLALTDAERAELGLDEPPAREEPAPAAPPVPVREPPATLAEVEQAFAATNDHEEVGRILLGYLGRSFRRVALFQTSRTHAIAWMALGDGIDQEAFSRYAVSFKQPSVFLNLRQGSGMHMGPLPPMETHRELALCWGGGLPRDCVLLPVRLKERLVIVIYADGGSRGLGGIDLEQMQRLVAATQAAFGRCVLRKKHGNAQS
jgi:Type II secretion system (T2SS), protein E, N-terminal domain